MRGEPELRSLISTLEEIVHAITTGTVGDARIDELGERHRASVDDLQGLFDGRDPLSETERQALAPLMADAARLNAVAAEATQRQKEHTASELEKSRRAGEAMRGQQGDPTGRSCDLAG